MSEDRRASTHSSETTRSGASVEASGSNAHREPARRTPDEVTNEVDVEARKRDLSAGTRTGQQPYGPKTHDNTSMNQAD